MKQPLMLIIMIGTLLLPGRLASSAEPCVGLQWPVSGPVVAGFRPINRYEGHWGIDLGVTPGTPVRAAAGGQVTFAGVVVANQTVTLDHGGGLKTSYSYLSETSVARGQSVRSGDVIGASGEAHGSESVHLSVRTNGTYVDPAGWFGCHPYQPSRALRLVE